MNKSNVIHCFPLATFPIIPDGNKYLFAVIFLPVSISGTEEHFIALCTEVCDVFPTNARQQRVKPCLPKEQISHSQLP